MDLKKIEFNNIVLHLEYLLTVTPRSLSESTVSEIDLENDILMSLHFLGFS